VSFLSKIFASTFKKIGSFLNTILSKEEHHTDKYTVKMLQNARGRTYPKLKQILHCKKILNKKEIKIMKSSLIVLSIGCFLLLFGIMQNHRENVPDFGGVYTEAVVGFPLRINPIIPDSEVDRDIASLIYTGLMQYGDEQKLELDLAESYEISEDNKTYTFKLRKDVLWHDGEPFTAYDVAYTFELIQNERVNSAFYVTFQGIQIDVVDEHTLSFVLQEPFVPFLSTLTVGILPEHIWGNVDQDRIHLAQSNIRGIGTGQYKYTKLKKNDGGILLNYTITRNENFYGKKPFIDEFVFKFFAEYEDAIQHIREKKVDALHFVPHEFRDKVERKHIVLHDLQLPQYTALFFNFKNDLLAESDIRDALSNAIDKKRIMHGAIGDEGKIIASPILPGFPGYDDTLKIQDYSLDKANELLDEDYSRISSDDYRKKLEESRFEEWEQLYEEEHPEPEEVDVTSTVKYTEEKVQAQEQAKIDIVAALDIELSEGQTFYRQDDDENVLSLRLVTADTEEYRKASEIIAGLWQDIGINIDIQYIPIKTIARETIKKRNYDVLLYGMILGSDPDQYPFWHSSQVSTPGLNLSGYDSADVDKILDAIRTESDIDKITEQYKQLQTELLEDKPALFLYTPTYTYATVDTVQGFRFERIFNPSDRFLHVDEWYIKTKGKWKL
jgi:ABC-type transport system substrate-binding protein